MEKSSNIVIVLPYGEQFSPAHSGAIGLCRKEYIEHSVYAEQIQVVGGYSETGHPGINYQQLPLNPGWFESKTKAYSKAVLKTAVQMNASVIEINNRPIMVRHLAKKTNQKLVLYLHNDPCKMKGAKTAKQRQWLLDHCAAIFCVSEFIKQQFMAGISTTAKNIYMAYPGIALPKVDLKTKQNYFLYSGRMIQEKGALAFAQALSIVLPQLPDWRGLMIGATERDSHADYEKQTRQTIDALGDRAQYLPFSSHQTVMDLFKQAHIAVVPSVWDEPFGRTAVEALASGCALICSDRGGLKEITQGAAVSLKTVTAEALAAQMLLLAQDAAMRQEYQSKAMARAQAFSIQQSTRQIDQYYAQIV